MKNCGVPYGRIEKRNMDTKYNKLLIKNAQNLRKRMTDEERKLWYCFLRNYPVRFFRQKVLYKYIADFYCPAVNLVIELDGSQHYEEKGLAYDEERNKFLEEHGIRVIHIANKKIHSDFRNVCEYIDMLVKGKL